MDPLLRSIRDAPLSYLPQVSLNNFLHFREQYSMRCIMEGKPHDWQFDRREFQEWLCRHFQLEGANTLADTTIVSSYSVDQSDAFSKYFSLLEEFLSLGNSGRPPSIGNVEKNGFHRASQGDLARPVMYLGHSTFQGCYSHLMGNELAYGDLTLQNDEGRVLFHDFQRWVETEENKGLPRPWYKVIEFWSRGIDCGHTPGGAFALFFTWFDQFTKQVGKEGILRLQNRSGEDIGYGWRPIAAN